MEKIIVIHDLRRQGLSISAIARKSGLDRKTVRKHVNKGVEPWSSMVYREMKAQVWGILGGMAGG